MSLKIGEVSKLLNMSVETIRFYESQNIIKPSRKADSKYRIYETWDIFFLMECMKYRSFDISVKDISKILHAESLDFFLQKIDEKQNRINDEIRYNTLLYEKIEQYRSSLETVELNEGNFWIKKIPEQLYFIYLSSQGDQYEELDSTNPLFSEWMNFLPFVEFGLHVTLKDLINRNTVDRIQWSLITEKKYADILKLPVNESVKFVPSQLCICTIINAGDKGNLSLKLFNPIMEYLQTSNYKICGDVIGKLLVRVHKSKRYCRYFEVQIPVNKK
ncbi:MAG TPA: MerR family transcriptional regulator [Thermoanaerobacterales bacterium]|nr:MerR family transcriptional regulator [Thermoanaerobacterales bacterium]